MSARTIGSVLRSGEAPTLDDYSRAIQAHIDSVARSRDYADGVVAASYKDDPDPAWAAQAAAFIAWRSSVWKYAYAQLDLVQTGQLTPPTIADLIQAAPPIAWPN